MIVYLCPNMQRDKKKKNFIKKPIYPGGLKAMRALIAKELKYPKEAEKNKIEGTVVVKYSINYLGEVTSSKVISGIGYGCDEEAMRIVSKLKFEVPKGPRKLKVKFGKTIKIHFKIPKKKAKPTSPKPLNQPSQPQISYTITKQKKEIKAPVKKPQSITYTIKYN